MIKCNFKYFFIDTFLPNFHHYCNNHCPFYIYRVRQSYSVQFCPLCQQKTLTYINISSFFPIHQTLKHPFKHLPSNQYYPHSKTLTPLIPVSTLPSNMEVQYYIKKLMIEQTFSQVPLIECDTQQKQKTAASFLKSTLMNIAYTLKNNCIVQLPFSSRVPLSFTQERQRAYLLGKAYDGESSVDFNNDFQQIIWFSYRRLPNQCEDVGWGCMIRVIQMMIAQAIARDRPQVHLNNLIDLFRDEKMGPLALSQICKKGNISGRWTSCPEILMVVSSILEDLKRDHRIDFNFQIFCDRLQIKKYQSYTNNNFPKLVTIHTKIGHEKTIGEDYLYHLLQLIKDKRFVGMASGKESEALYIVGAFQELAIILDPHYVQQEQSFSTFFPKNPQGIRFNELSSGVSLSFYIPSLEEFESFVAQLIYSNKVANMYTCFELDVHRVSEWSTSSRKGSDDFQLL